MFKFSYDLKTTLMIKSILRLRINLNYSLVPSPVEQLNNINIVIWVTMYAHSLTNNSLLLPKKNKSLVLQHLDHTMMTLTQTINSLLNTCIFIPLLFVGF